ncbi:MAG: hypothetical protein AB8B82_06585 [Roseovarius sp.]
MKILHITNGDGAANIIKATGLLGDVLSWRDPMHHGPFPAGASLEALQSIRAQSLAGPGMDASEVERDFKLRDAHLNAAPQYESVVLWFEHDLLDQLQILQLLDWFQTAALPDTTLEMICINHFPGRPEFRGIGELDPAQMASLFDQRAPVTAHMLKLAGEGWQAFCSDDPRHLQAFMTQSLDALPFVHAALSRHLEEYPDAANGLTRTEQQLLELVSEGVHAPDALFLRNMERETALFMGDWPTYAILSRLSQAGMLECDPAPFSYNPLAFEDRDAFVQQALTLTAKGRAALAGQRADTDWIQRDQWLGGVHIHTDQPHWVWNAQRQDLQWHPA